MPNRLQHRPASLDLGPLSEKLISQEFRHAKYDRC